MWELQVCGNFENCIRILQKLDENAKERTLGCLLVKGTVSAVHSAV